MAREGATLNLGSQIHSEITRQGISFNVMLVGEAGLGKSTAVRSLFRPFTPRGQPASWLAPGKDVIRPRTVQIEEHQLKLESDGYPVNITIIDCPGYGDSLDASDSIAPILECIRSRFAKHYDALVSGIDHGTRLGHDDRVHCCLYFIGAHRLKGIDVSAGLALAAPESGADWAVRHPPSDRAQVQFMQALQRHVPIVPLIAKSDTMTTAERDAFRELIISELATNGVECLHLAAVQQPLPQRAHSESAARSGSSRSEPIAPSRFVSLKELGAPFAIAASESGVREYPWGKCNCEDPAHSDLARLRDVLLSANLMRARERTHELYEESYASRRRAADAAAADALRLRFSRQERALRLAGCVVAAMAVVAAVVRVRAALPAARVVQLDRTASELGSGLAGASRATVRGVNAWALSPLWRYGQELGNYVRPTAWARALARRLED